MIREDDRTPEQVTTHRYGVVARDRAMSHWGKARGGYSRYAWAVAPHPDDPRIEAMLAWVKSRCEMWCVQVVDLTTYQPPRRTAHFHIYRTNECHPAYAGLHALGRYPTEVPGAITPDQEDAS